MKKLNRLSRLHKLELRKPGTKAKKKKLRKQLERLKREIQLVRNDFNELDNNITQDIILTSQVITTTLLGADHSSLGNVFSTVFIDEAAQALEPAAWVPISKAKKLIMAGDHFQLPPVVRSESPEEGLGKTLFEKVITNHSVGVMLRRQYRMNEHIMNFSNNEFYGSELVADNSVRTQTIEKPFNFKILNAVEFLDTKNLNAAEKNYSGSKSWFNEVEAELLVNHLQNILNIVGSQKEQNFSIGIISPYKGQVLYLQNMIKESLPIIDKSIRVDVNSIDAFQGQERDIIYISLVRSNQRKQIGFLRETRRMNVAITRAKKKLIVIGDSTTISKSIFYKRFIEYVKNIHGYKLLENLMNLE